MWIHSAPTQGSDWHTHMQRNPLLHQISLPSHEKKRQATPAFRQKLLSYSNKHKAAIDKKKMSSLRACKKKKVSHTYFSSPSAANRTGGRHEFISIPRHPADSPPLPTPRSCEIIPPLWQKHYPRGRGEVNQPCAGYSCLVTSQLYCGGRGRNWQMYIKALHYWGAAPVKLSSRWDRVRFAPRRRVRENERRTGRKRRSWGNKVFFFPEGASSFYPALAAHVYLLNKEERCSPEINKLPRYTTAIHL